MGSEAEDGERALAAVTRREALAMAKVTEVWAADTIAIALSLSRSHTLALALALPPFLFLPPSRLRSVEARNVSVQQQCAGPNGQLRCNQKLSGREACVGFSGTYSSRRTHLALSRGSCSWHTELLLVPTNKPSSMARANRWGVLATTLVLAILTFASLAVRRCAKYHGTPYPSRKAVT